MSGRSFGRLDDVFNKAAVPRVAVELRTARRGKVLVARGAHLTPSFLERRPDGAALVAGARAFFDAHLADKPALVAELEQLRLDYDAMNKKKEHNDEANKAAKKSIFGQLGAVKLKKAMRVTASIGSPGRGP